MILVLLLRDDQIYDYIWLSMNSFKFKTHIKSIKIFFTINDLKRKLLSHLIV